MNNPFNFKIRTKNTKENREVQEILFSLGYDWFDGLKNIQKTETRYFYFQEEEFTGKRLSIYYEYSKNKKTFIEDKNKEITIEELRDKKFQNKLRKLVILRNLKQ